MSREIVRIEPRQAVLRRLQAAVDHFFREEDRAIASGYAAEVEGAHQYAILVNRALRAERDNPVPDGLRH